MANTAQFHHFLLDPKLSEESNIAFDKCAHTQNQTIALVWFQEFILFILNGSRISVGHLQDTMVFAENQLFSVTYFSRVTFLWKTKLFLSYKDFMFPFFLWNTKSKDTQTQAIYINCKYMNRESDKVKLRVRNFRLSSQPTLYTLPLLSYST